MPEFVLAVRSHDSGDKARALMLIYSEDGDDPFREGPLEGNRRISQCHTVAARCVSRVARKEFGTARNDHEAK